MKPSETATIESGISISLVSWQPVTITAGAPGEIAGDGVGLDVRVDNRSNEPIDLSNVVADLRFGPDQVPALRTERPPTNPFTGTLQPGESAVATYAFLLDAKERADVVLLLSLNPEVPVIVFDGALR